MESLYDLECVLVVLGVQRATLEEISKRTNTKLIAQINAISYAEYTLTRRIKRLKKEEAEKLKG